MAFSHQVTRGTAGMSNPVSRTTTFTASSEVSVDEEVADSVTDQLINISIDVSAISSFYMVSNYALTVETNSSSAPAETINLVADVPFVETSDNYHADILATDITALYVTNSSGSTASFKLRCVFDATP